MAPSDTDFDAVIVGAGIIGLATAAALARWHSPLRVVVVDKEGVTAAHQSGRNSGVIHSGVYYAPDSAKARLCRRGRAMLVRYCEEQGIAHEICGKVIVATRADELGRLDDLHRRGTTNGVSLERIGPDRLRELEPYAHGVAALHVHDAGIADYPGVCAALAHDVVAAGGEVRLGTEVLSVNESTGSVNLTTSGGDISARWLLNCAGLFADTVAAMAGVETDLRILPMRGEYMDLRPERRHLVRNLIYPVPDPSFPFLGVHLTRTIGGGIHAGPNAVPALAREGYDWLSIDLGHVRTLLDAPVRRLGLRHWRTAINEITRSWFPGRFGDAVRRLVPAVRDEDLEFAPAGVRAQALDGRGNLVDDFAFADSTRSVHVLNAPSPGATASLAIGEEIAARLTERIIAAD
jgi:L-2-hydroxyglutarate oxidase